MELDGIVEEVVAELAADDASVRIGTLEPVELLGDRQALRRLARNLIDNALVHGRGTVSVSVAHAGGDALLSVSDEGGGPDPDEVGLIFERFGRGRAASGRPGSGLGLSIVAAIAHNHGGRVSVAGSHVHRANPGDLESHSGGILTRLLQACDGLRLRSLP